MPSTVKIDGEGLRRILRTRNIPFQTFAKQIGIVPTRLSDIFRTNRTSQETWERMLSVLHVGAEVLAPPSEGDQLERELLRIFRQMDVVTRSRLVVAAADLLQQSQGTPPAAGESEGVDGELLARTEEELRKRGDRERGRGGKSRRSGQAGA